MTWINDVLYDEQSDRTLSVSIALCCIDYITQHLRKKIYSETDV